MQEIVARQQIAVINVGFLQEVTSYFYNVWSC